VREWGWKPFFRRTMGYALRGHLGVQAYYYLAVMFSQLYFQEPQRRFVYCKTEGGASRAFSIEETLCAAGATRQVENLEGYYKRNVYWGSECALQAPPVQRLYAIYGINLETELLYCYKENKGKPGLLFDQTPNMSGIPTQGFVLRDGIVYETPERKQANFKLRTGLDTPCCGDGTVPYQSLSHAVHWRDSIPDIRIEEIDGAEHRAILNNKAFFKLLIEYVSKRKETQDNRNTGLFLADIDDFVVVVSERAF